MAYKSIDSDEAARLKLTVKEPNIKLFSRHGFSVVEWGGSEIKN